MLFLCFDRPLASLMWASQMPHGNRRIFRCTDSMCRRISSLLLLLYSHLSHFWTGLSLLAWRARGLLVLDWAGRCAAGCGCGVGVADSCSGTGIGSAETEAAGKNVGTISCI